MLWIGIDSGSTTTKGVAYDGEKIVNHLIVPTGYNPRQTMEFVRKQLVKDSSDFITTTGYGRALLENVNLSITEISCHAVGANEIFPGIKTILDIGGQDSKAISLSSDGSVSEFIMNDKCAAGTGRFLEVIMRILHKDMLDLDALAQNHNPVKISSMCAVFAESEVIGLLASGFNSGDVALGVIESICERSINFVKRLHNSGPLLLTGGLGQSEIIRSTLEKHLNDKVIAHSHSQIAGALGAAKIGYLRTK